MYKDSLFIEKIHVYKNDIVVKRIPIHPPKENTIKGKKEAITMFSSSSRRKLAFMASNTDVKFLTFITLTYPARWTKDGRVVKKNLKAFIQWLRRRDSEVEYLWFLEFQRRGAPHYHILVDSPIKCFDFQELSYAWARIVDKNIDPDHLKAGTRVESVRKGGNLAHYAVKYAMKMYQKNVPELYQNVGRFWGVSKGVKPKLRQVHPIASEKDLQLYLSKWLKENRSRSIDYRVLFNATEYLSEQTGLTY